MKRFYIALFIITFFFLPLFTHAQTPGSIDSIEIRVNPENPAPESPVTIKVESYLSDLNKATIFWSVDGKQVAGGVGQTSFVTKAPSNSKTSTISIYLRTVEGRELRRSLTLHPGDISITWEALGYEPPFYPGKAIPVYQGAVKFVAMPNLFTKNGTYIDPDTLLYTWKKGSTVLGSESGYGKQSVVIKGGIIPEPTEISVSVQSKDGSISGEASTEIDFYSPQIVFYKEDPLYGILYNKALTKQEPLTNNEMKIAGIPFGFTDLSFLSFDWSVNNNDKAELKNQKSVTFRNNSDAEGSSIISLEIKNSKSILQSAKSNFAVYFNKQNKQ